MASLEWETEAQMVLAEADNRLAVDTDSSRPELKAVDMPSHRAAEAAELQDT
jgi:hypothetical protein